MNFLEDPLTVQSQSQSRCRDSFQIPIDLVIDIFSRLPAKSAAKCVCLSKLWANIISSQYFVDLFLAKSSARPKILFSGRNNSKISFFSAHQPSENSDDNIAPTHDDVTHYPVSSYACPLSVPISGLVCLTICSGIGKIPESVIHNPSTGEFLPLPKIKTRGQNIENFLGYDQNERHFKVLSLNSDFIDRGIRNCFVEYQVLTLETKEMSWRMIECCTPHIPGSMQSEICINGILYYQALGVSMVQLIVCFDVRSETFKFINVMETSNKNLPWTTILTNYNGKLGLLIPEESGPILSGESRSFELWVLKDAENTEWSKHVFVLPPAWKEVVGETRFLKFVGMIGTNKIVLSSFHRDETSCIFSYNISKNTMRRINIQGMESSADIDVYVFLNHVENLMSLFKFLK